VGPARARGAADTIAKKTPDFGGSPVYSIAAKGVKGLWNMASARQKGDMWPVIMARFRASPGGAKMPHGLFPPDIAAAGKL